MRELSSAEEEKADLLFRQIVNCQRWARMAGLAREEERTITDPYFYILREIGGEELARRAHFYAESSRERYKGVRS